MKATFDCFLLYSDADFLFCEIRGDKFYEKVNADDSLKQHLSFSSCPSKHPLDSSTKKMVTLKFNDELRRSVIREFVGLKAKIYSII